MGVQGLGRVGPCVPKEGETWGPVLSYEGFNWVLDEADDFEIENGSIIGIKVLDKLQTLLPNSGSHASSLIGNITIDIAGYAVNEADLSAKYLNENVYPNLKIKYGSNTDGVIESYYVNFYN